jgi:hypothetical protein
VDAPRCVLTIVAPGFAVEISIYPRRQPEQSACLRRGTSQFRKCKDCLPLRKFCEEILDPNHPCGTGPRLLGSLFVAVDGPKGMADYYLLIRDAIAVVDEKTGKDRSVFYDRARAVLVDEFGKADPPLSETLIEQELLALEEAIKRIEAEAAPTDAKQQHRRFVFWGFLILSALWIGDLLYRAPTFSNWYDWLGLGGFIFFPTMAILSYFIMRENWSVEKEERAYIVITPIILVGAVVLSVVVHFALGRLGATPS